ncbi:MAG: hypothetical protein ACOX8Q_03405 [Christensenellales bacterium]
MNKNRKNHQKHEIKDDYVALDIMSNTECTGMIPTPPLSSDDVDGYSEIYSVTQQEAINAQKADTAKQQKRRSSKTKNR